MESDDDYESFSFPNSEPSPSPSPKHRRLKRLKKSTDVSVQSTTVDSVTESVDLPKVDFARLEALESSNIRAFDDNNNNNDDDDVLCEPPSDCFNGDGVEKELSHRFSNGNGDGDEKELSDGDGDGEKVKELRSCYDDEAKEDQEIKEVAAIDDDVEKELGCGDVDDDVEKELGDVVVKTDRKETKRQLDFGDDDDDDVDESGVDKMVGKEGESVDLDIKVDEEKEGDENVVNEKKWKNKKKRSKSCSDDKPKAKSTYTSKRREEKERRAHLDQLHVESQRILRETRGVSFKPVPLVQKPISSILERIKQRKLEVSKKFSQSNANDSHKEDDEHVVIDHSKSVETEVSDLSESLKDDKVSNVYLVSDDVGMDGPDVCGQQKGDVNAGSQKELDVEATPALRAPVDDTQELFGDSHTSDSKESEDDESCENDSSSQEEEMGPSLLTMKLKFDSAPDDICDEEEEENDKENVDPHGQEHSSPRGDPAKAFVDDEAEEEDDSDNDQMVFGDDEEDEDEDDIEELNKMIVTGYKERPIDLEARNELHQKWLEEKDEAGTDVILRKFNLDSKLREASLLDEEEGDVDVEMNDDDDANEDDDENDVEEEAEAERPRLTRINAKKAKEMIAQMFTDKDDEYISSDDEETEKILVRERLLNKDKEKGRMLSLIEDEDSREVFGLIKKLNTVPEVRKKANATSFFDTLLTGGNSNSSSKSSFFSRKSNNSVPFSSKQGGSSGARSFIFGRDDSNSRSSISLSENMPDTTTSSETQTKKVTVKYKSSQSQGRSSTQTTNLVSESSSSSFFELLKRSSAQSNVHNHDHKVELSQSVFDAFKIPKKPIKIQGRV